MRKLSSWIDVRAVPLMATMVLALVGAVYSFVWMSLAHKGWLSYSDLGNSTGLAYAIGHGHVASVYAPSSQLESPPGFEILLAPLMLLAHAVGLGSSLTVGAHAKTLTVVMTGIGTAMGCTLLFALDAVARHWDYSEAKRFALAAVAGLGVVSAAAFWGHPEDAIALALVLWAALAVERRANEGWRQAGWLLGLAVACQPLALLAVAPVVARAGWRDLRAVAWRLALPSIVVLLPELLATPQRALHAVMEQPFFPPADSGTPFSHLARPIGHGMYSGGTLRLLVTVAAVALGYLACRRRTDLPFVLFIMAAAFTLRVVFESELLGYYFLPVVALCLLLTLRGGWSRFEAAAVLSVVSLALGNRRQHEIVLWWPGIIGATVALLVLAYASLPAHDAGGAELRRLARAPRADAPWTTISHVRLLDA